jgi:VanZ family protein
LFIEHMFKYLWPALVWSLVILLLTLTPGEKLPEVGIFQIDKLVHFFVFALLMFLAAYGLKKVFLVRSINASAILVSAIYSCALGVSVEILQLFVPNRSFSWADIIANTIGTGIGYFVFNYVRQKNIF